jgi:hypothetical protein
MQDDNESAREGDVALRLMLRMGEIGGSLNIHDGAAHHEIA